VVGYFDALNGRVIVTYAGVPATGTTQPNNLQVVIYDSGKIENDRRCACRDWPDLFAQIYSGRGACCNNDDDEDAGD